MLMGTVTKDYDDIVNEELRSMSLMIAATKMKSLIFYEKKIRILI